MTMRTRDVPVDCREAELIIQALKRSELADGESERSRLLIQRFRRARSMLAAHEEPETAEIQEDIFSAGAAA